MRLVAWNVGHQTRHRDLPIAAARALLSVAPDVIVLNEYVSDSRHDAALDAFAQAGLPNVAASSYVRGQNQVLVVSKLAIREGNIVCDVGLSDATAPNWLHVRLADDVDVVGFRQPMLNGIPRGVSRYWTWLTEAIEPLRTRNAVVIGDFNCSAGARCLRPAQLRGWQVATPADGWSFLGKSGHRTSIDHALVADRLRVDQVTYCATADSYSFAGEAGAYSDHAVVVLDVSEVATLRPPHTAE